MEKPTIRRVGIFVGHSLKTRPMEFYRPVEVDAYIAHLEQRAEAAESARDKRIADYRHLVEQHMPRSSDGCDEGWSRVIEARELQTKLEASEAYAKSLNDIIDSRERDLRAAEAKLAELAKQKPIGWLNDAYLGRGVIDGEVGEDDFGPGYIPIYRHPFNDVPAPPADLSEMCDRQYIAGLQAGFRIGDAGDNEGLRKATANYRKQIIDNRNATTPAADMADMVPDDTKRMDWLVSMCVEVRKPLRYGSEHVFYAVATTDEEDDYHATTLREQIDAILRNIQEAKK